LNGNFFDDKAALKGYVTACSLTNKKEQNMAKVAGLEWSKISAPKLSKEELNARIQKKAKELWEQKGCVQNQDLDIWLEAEKLVKSGKA
jgi:hypothetical protein